ncbi:MAG: hydrogenase [Lentisphaerae bacterium]|nr:hydrogenase [Lentisphaerota bacterium]
MPNHLSSFLLLVAAVLSALSGVPALVLPRKSAAGQRIATGLMVVAGLVGLTGVVLVFLRGTDAADLSWRMLGSPLRIVIDSMSAFFLVPVLAMGALGSIYGLRYWPQRDHPENGRGLGVFWGLTVAGMILLLVARHAALFLVGWELMAISAFFMIATESHLPEVRSASWVYFVATHLGTLALFALFALFHRITGSFELRALGVSEAGLGELTAIFLLALVGFGIKAGLMPLHFWLPSAHAGAPSHVSALLSGVLLKIGIYGIVRFVGFLPEPPVGWGGLVLVLGCISGVLGVVFALGQHDLKRLLAYHSVENIGIILMGFGLALLGHTWNQPLLYLLGMAGCLLHVWNHALFKSLLFLGAGSVVHACGTREIDRLGGLSKSMPWTAGLFLVSAVAICGLPPLNGFVSEWFIYLGFFNGVAADEAYSWLVAGLAAPVLALIGALALACFVKAYGAVFLGAPRRPLPDHPHEAPLAMTLPMGILAVCCFAIGLFPQCVVPLLQQAISGGDGGGLPDALPLLEEQTPLGSLTLAGGLLLGLCLLLLVAVVRRIQWRDAPTASTWSCGYARPTERMQYTASSFAQMLTGLFGFVLRPQVHLPGIRALFSRPAKFGTHIDEPVLDRTLLPALRRIKRSLNRVRSLQQGLTHHYLMYVAFMVVALLLWVLPVTSVLTRLFSR